MSPLDTWTVSNTRFDPQALGQHNSVFTISNGYLGLKGNLCEDRDGYCPVTLINGIYDELDVFGQIRCSNQPRRYLDPAHFDTAGKSPAVANLPNPLMVRLFVEDEEVSLGRGQVTGFEQQLDMRDGGYSYSLEYVDASGRRTRIEMLRFAPLVQPHRVYMRYSVRPLNYGGRIRLLSGIDGRTWSNTTRERQFTIQSMTASPCDECRMCVRTNLRGHEVRIAVKNDLRKGWTLLSTRGVVAHDSAWTELEFDAQREKPIELDRHVMLTSSEDDSYGAFLVLGEEFENALATPLEAARQANRREWERLWERADVQIEGDPLAQRYLRFCLFHLLQAAPRFTDRLSVPVKLLTGESYQGNTFYDTDLYIEPFYLFTFPALARTCLNWRYCGLVAGAEIARGLGCAGAKFAWQAGPNGEECLGKWWRFTHTNIHINGDVAHSLMQYGWATGDEDFLRNQGLGILVATARFYASRAVYDAKRDAYDLRDVAGPDEGHCESTNNFYTNWFAIRNLRWAADVVERLKAADPDACPPAARWLDLDPDEPARWRHVADRLTLLFDPRTKLYEQCEGFYRLEPLAPGLSRERKVWFETVAPYQALNQPDVLMAMALHRDDFSEDVRRANWEFYKDKSMNFSSMSFVINSIMAADMGEMERAYSEFLISAGQDIDEELTGRRDTYAGLHGTAAGGAWMAAVFGFGGVHLSESGLHIRPRLPAEWKGMRFSLMLRGQRVSAEIDHETVSLTAKERPIGLAVSVAGRPVTLAGGTQTIRYGDPQ